jgi:Fe-S-cluster containining protein
MVENIKDNPCWPCANCCKNVIVRVRDEDLGRWKKENRYDILLCLEEITAGAVFMIRKKNGECIFLTEKGCSIYDMRPKVCRLFPTSKKHAEEFNCKLKDILFKQSPKENHKIKTK